MGTAQARNATHSEKKLTDEGLAAFVKRFDIPIPESAAKDGTFYQAGAGFAGDACTCRQRRQELGGYHAGARGAEARVQGAGAGAFQGVDWRVRRAAPFRRRWALSASCGT